jgi:hypothetical protein
MSFPVPPKADPLSSSWVSLRFAAHGDAGIGECPTVVIGHAQLDVKARTKQRDREVEFSVSYRRRQPIVSYQEEAAGLLQG